MCATSAAVRDISPANAASQVVVAVMGALEDATAMEEAARSATSVTAWGTLRATARKTLNVAIDATERATLPKTVISPQILHLATTVTNQGTWLAAVQKLEAVVVAVVTAPPAKLASIVTRLGICRAIALRTRKLAISATSPATSAVTATRTSNFSSLQYTQLRLSFVPQHSFNFLFLLICFLKEPEVKFT